MEIPYINNKLNGVFKTWYGNGQLYTEEHYKDDMKEGDYREWNLNGKLIRHYIYKNDTKIKTITGLN